MLTYVYGDYDDTAGIYNGKVNTCIKAAVKIGCLKLQAGLSPYMITASFNLPEL